MLSPDQLKAGVCGLLTFPVTAFKAGSAGPAAQLDLDAYAHHLEFLLAHRPAALFACGGTGEFFSLTLSEYREAIRVAVEVCGGRVPVVAGCGYGTAMAIEFAKAAEQSGADGLLVLPPYLLESEQEGLYAHYAAIARSVGIGVILYQRDNAIFAEETLGRLCEIPNIVGFKDGRGDMERLQRSRLAAGDRLAWINGMPTAEISAAAFAGVGVTSYSSAIFNFAPQISTRFYRALCDRDEPGVMQLLQDVIVPLCRLREKQRGYAISFVKAGVELIGRRVGPVRPPLVPLAEHDKEALRVILQRVGALDPPTR